MDAMTLLKVDSMSEVDTIRKYQLDNPDIPQWDKYRESKAPIEVLFTDERGQGVWAVKVKGTDFWLAFYRTEDKARKFAKEWKE